MIFLQMKFNHLVNFFMFIMFLMFFFNLQFNNLLLRLVSVKIVNKLACVSKHTTEFFFFTQFCKQ